VSDARDTAPLQVPVPQGLLGVRLPVRQVGFHLGGRTLADGKLRASAASHTTNQLFSHASSVASSSSPTPSEERYIAALTLSVSPSFHPTLDSIRVRMHAVPLPAHAPGRLAGDGGAPYQAAGGSGGGGAGRRMRHEPSGASVREAGRRVSAAGGATGLHRRRLLSLFSQGLRRIWNATR
jgi:hypothetical protein